MNPVPSPYLYPLRKYLMKIGIRSELSDVAIWLGSYTTRLFRHGLWRSSHTYNSYRNRDFAFLMHSSWQQGSYEGEKANSRPVLARDWTRGQHKRVIILSFYFFFFLRFWLFLMITTNRAGMDNGTTEWHDTVPSRHWNSWDIYPGTLMRLRYVCMSHEHELYIDWLL